MAHSKEVEEDNCYYAIHEDGEGEALLFVGDPLVEA
jgi:hypothetical protein